MKNMKISLLSLLLVSSSAWAMQAGQISGEEVQRLIDGARGNVRELNPNISEAELAVVTSETIKQLRADAAIQRFVFSSEAEAVLKFEGGAEVQVPAPAARPASPAPQVQQPQAQAPAPAPAARLASPVPAPAAQDQQPQPRVQLTPAELRAQRAAALDPAAREKAAAAVKIQSVVRGRRARSAAQEARERAAKAAEERAAQAAAAVRIQSVVRGRQARSAARVERERAAQVERERAAQAAAAQQREENKKTAYGRCKNTLQDWNAKVQATKPVQYVKTNPNKSITGLLALCAAAWFFWTAEEEEEAVKAPAPVQQKTGLFGARQAAPVRTVKKESFAVRAKKTVKNWWNGFYTWATKDVK